MCEPSWREIGRVMMSDAFEVIVGVDGAEVTIGDDFGPEYRFGKSQRTELGELIDRAGQAADLEAGRNALAMREGADSGG